MRSVDEGGVRIGELVVRVPGLSAADAQALGDAVARKVGAALASRAPTPLDLAALDLRLVLPRSTAPADLVDPIADAILARIG